MARPRDPTRARRGTGHRRDVPAVVPTGPTEIAAPGPPAGLPPAAADLWHVMIAELWPRGLRDSDLEGVRLLVLAAHRNREAAALVERDGLVVANAAGSPVANPAVKIEKDTAATFLRFADQFGLTLAARLRLGLMQLAGESMLASLDRDLDG